MSDVIQLSNLELTTFSRILIDVPFVMLVTSHIVNVTSASVLCLDVAPITNCLAAITLLHYAVAIAMLSINIVTIIDKKGTH